MTREEKALLDMIAYAEGTLGVSKNGYDVLVGFRIIKGWTPNTNISHGNRNWYSKANNSTAAGRYQFIHNTWVSDGKNLPMTKENQDKKGVSLINQRLGSINKGSLVNKASFDNALNKLCLEWASIPVTTDIIDSNGVVHKAGFSYYDKDGINKSKHTSNKLFEIYNAALSKY